MEGQLTKGHLTSGSKSHGGLDLGASEGGPGGALDRGGQMAYLLRIMAANLCRSSVCIAHNK